MWRVPALLFTVLLPVFFAGCGGESFPLAPVSGRLTLDGEPLAGARVGFEPRAEGESPVAGWGSYGRTDENGRYTLSTVHGEPGAVVATHEVWIRTFRGADGQGGPTSPERLPARYHDQSVLSFTVPAEGSDAANFDLVSDLK